MRELIPKDQFGVFVDNKDTARGDNLYVAKFFDKEHKNVILDIRKLDCSDEFRQLNFEQFTYKNEHELKTIPLTNFA